MANSKIPNITLADTLNTQRLRINQLLDSVGDVSALTTAAGPVTNAINELDAELGTITSGAMGTTASTVSGAINELDGRLDSINNTELLSPRMDLTDAAATNTVAGKLEVGDSADFADNVSVDGNLTVGGNTTMVGTLTVDGQVTFKAGSDNNISLGDAATDTITLTGEVNSNVIPDANNTYDLGSALKEWRHVYVDGTVNADNVAADSATIGTLKVTDLTDNRVVIVGTGGELEGDTNFTFDGNVFSVGNTSIDKDAVGINTTGLEADSATITNNADIGGNLDVGGNFTADGNVDLGNASTDTVSITGQVDTDIVPSSNNARSLGSNIKQWRHGYFDGTVNADELAADSATMGTAKVSDLTEDRVVIVGPNGELEDHTGLTYDGTTLNVAGDLDVDTSASIASAKIEDLTDNRVVIAGTGGELEDDANLTFDGSTFTVGLTNIVQATGNTNVGGDLDVSGNVQIDGNLTVDGIATLKAGTDNNINLGDIDATTDTVTFNAEVASHITPDDGNTYDLGSSNKEWRHGYFDGTVNADELAADSATLGTVKVTDLTAGRIVTVGTNGEVQDDADLTYSPTTDTLSVSNIDIGTQADLASAKVEDLTNNRIVIAGTGGELEDDANLTFDGTTLAATAAVDITGDLDVDNININGNTVTSTNTNGAINITPDGTGEVVISTATVSDLTDNRIIVAGTSGALEDDANLTFDGTTFEVGTNFDVDVATGNTNIDGNLDVDGTTDLDDTNVDGDLDVTGSFTTIDTDGLTEGDNNLYYTTARADSDARSAVSATDAGGDGSFAYDSATGVFTYTGPSATDVRAHITAGEGIDIVDGEIRGENATTSNKGIASFDTNDFNVSSGAVSLVDSVSTRVFTAIDYFEDGSGRIRWNEVSSFWEATDSTGNYYQITVAGPSTGGIRFLDDDNDVLFVSAATGEGSLKIDGDSSVQTNLSGSILTISVDDATVSTKGIASFDSDNFTVSSGAVSIKDATTANKGIASFNTNNFSVSLGEVSIKNDGITLGTETTGNYVATIAGTANEIEVTGSGSETASVTVGLPNDVTVGNNLTVTNDFTVGGSFTVAGEQRTAAQYIFLLDGTTGTPSLNSGITVDRGSEDSAVFQWNETGDYWEAGTKNSLNRLALQDDSANFTSLSVNNDLVVSGNLDIRGTTTTIDTTNLTIEDNLIILNGNQTGTPSTALRSGLEIERGDASNAKFQFNENTDEWEFTGPKTGTLAVTGDIGNATITLTAGTDLSTGGDFTTNQSGNETITINHADITRTNTTTTASPAYGATFTAIDTLTTNARGHVTGANTKTVTLPAAYSLPLATNTVRGGIELFNNTDQSVAANSVTTTAGRTYGLQLNSANQGVINVPWTDTVYSLPLATDTVRGGIELFDNTDQSVAANSVTTAANRTYGIQLNSANQAVVNVPWVDTNTDTNTTYSTSIPSSTTKLRLTGSDATTDDIEFVGGGATTVTRTDANTFTISSTDTNTDTNTTYSAGKDLDLNGTTFDIESTLNHVNAITTATDTDFTLTTGGSGDIYLDPAGGNVYMRSLTATEQINFQINTGSQEMIASDDLSIGATGELTIYTTSGGDVDLNPNSGRIGLFDNGSERAGFDVNTADTLKIYTGANFGTLNSTFSGDDLTVQGDFNSVSDVRTKENIETVENGLDLVSQLRGVWYNKIGEEDRKVGVIAQEVEEVLPEVVHTNTEGMKSVDYGKMVGVLIEAIKELKQEIDELKGK